MDGVAILFLQSLIVLLSITVILKIGIFSYPGLFSANCILYFILLPWAADGSHIGLNFALVPTTTFLSCALLYQAGFLAGLMVTIKAPYLRPNLGSSIERQAEQSFVEKLVLYIILIVAGIFVIYSLVTRNIFESEGLLFTVLGFDMFAVVYMYNRGRRQPVNNLGFFAALITLYMYAGFRYRIALIVGMELACLNYRKAGLLKITLLISTVLFGLIWFSAFVSVREYGSFSLPSLSAENFDLKSALVSSGEQTVTRATMTMADGIDGIDLYGLEPVQVVLTHFIPAAIYPDKPRAQYLESYFVVSPELKGTGAAMHDMAQFLGMFGFWGLPFVSFAAGCFWGKLYVYASKLAPNRYMVAGLLMLFGFLMPTRGYLAQQLTWALTFVGVLVTLRFFAKRGLINLTRQTQRLI